MPFAHNGDCEIYYESFGDPADPALLLINGMTSQCIFYAEPWCRKFVDRGFFVIRFDNRDVGLSTSFAGARLDPATGSPYTLSDMAADAVAVLDAVGVARAHIHGLSLGGMIAQTIAIEHPERVVTLTSVMSTSGEDEYRRAAPEAQALLTAPAPATPAQYVEQHIEGLRVYGSPAFADESRWRADAEAAVARSFRPDGPGRQFLASRASGSRADGLRRLRVPTLVIHGSHDTLIDPVGGRRTAELIPGAQLVIIEGMGHDYPPALWDRWCDLVAAHALGRG